MNETDNASKALDEFANGPAKDAAELSAQAFEQAGERIAKALENAALTGEFSFRDMAAAITRDLARLAINDLILSPLQGVIDGIGSKGQSPSNPISVVMNVSGVSDAGSFQKSQGQIAASLSRAVSNGKKYI